MTSATLDTPASATTMQLSKPRRPPRQSGQGIECNIPRKAPKGTTQFLHPSIAILLTDRLHRLPASRSPPDTSSCPSQLVLYDALLIDPLSWPRRGILPLLGACKVSSAQPRPPHNITHGILDLLAFFSIAICFLGSSFFCIIAFLHLPLCSPRSTQCF